MQHFFSRNFIDEIHFTGSWDSFEVDFTHYQEVNGSVKFSVLDHIFWTENLHSSVTNAGVYHSPDNLSDHSPVYCEIACDISPDSRSSDKSSFVPKPKWKLANLEEKDSFKEKLDCLLQAVDVPASVFGCKNVHCQYDQHFIDSDSFMSSILNCL